MHSYFDRSTFAQCRTCGDPMIGIMSIAAREDCYGCGGVALYVLNKEPSNAEEFADKMAKYRGFRRQYGGRKL